MGDESGDACSHNDNLHDIVSLQTFRGAVARPGFPR